MCISRPSKYRIYVIGLEKSVCHYVRVHRLLLFTKDRVCLYKIFITGRPGCGYSLEKPQEVLLMNTHNRCLKKELKKIILEL